MTHEEIEEKRYKENKIEYLKKFGCNCDRYDPYRNGDAPEFSGESPLWF